MEDWQLFEDIRFALRFHYPRSGTDGEAVERVEVQRDGMLRAHILTPNSREVYFEVTMYESQSVDSVYQQHRRSLEKQFHPLKITELTETSLTSLPAHRYTFEFDQSTRTAVLLVCKDATFRILYNPRFPINMRILSTVEWLSLP